MTNAYLDVMIRGKLVVSNKINIGGNKMTGKQWDEYFKTLTRERKEELRQAIEVLKSDPMFKKYYGRDFTELASILDFPFNQKY